MNSLLDRFAAPLDLRGGRVLQEDGVLVPAEAGQTLFRPQGLPKAAADLAQELISGCVAQRVIDELESIEIKEEHMHVVPAGKSLLQPVQEQNPVG